jgi:hypothetical protein
LLAAAFFGGRPRNGRPAAALSAFLPPGAQVDTEGQSALPGRGSDATSTNVRDPSLKVLILPAAIRPKSVLIPHGMTRAASSSEQVSRSKNGILSRGTLRMYAVNRMTTKLYDAA